MSAAFESSALVKDFQTNLVNFVNAVQSMAICTQNLAKIMGNVDTSQTIANKALLDWSQNLFVLADAFEADAKSQLTACVEKDHSQALAMNNIYERLHFFLNHMTHSYFDFSRDFHRSDLSRSESPMSASYECQPQNITTLQQHNRFRNLQQQYRRWSEAACTAEPSETVDNNRRWSMPTNVSKTQSRFMMYKLAGLVNQNQTTIPDQTTTNSDGVIEAIQLLSFKAPSRPPSVQHSSQLQHFRSQPSTQRQRQQRGEINEILVLPRPNDSLYLGRYQQIVENIRGESDEY